MESIIGKLFRNIVIESSKIDLFNFNVIFFFSLRFSLWCSALEAPAIIEHPLGSVERKSSPFTLKCEAKGSPAPQIKWFKNGELLTIEPGHQMVLPSGDLFFLSVQHRNRQNTDSGVYWCEARNELGVARSRNASLLVSTMQTEFRLDPEDVQVALGETAIMECGAPKGTPEPIISWRKNGQMMDLTGSKR